MVRSGLTNKETNSQLCLDRMQKTPLRVVSNILLDIFTFALFHSFTRRIDALTGLRLSLL